MSSSAERRTGSEALEPKKLKKSKSIIECDSETCGDSSQITLKSSSPKSKDKKEKSSKSRREAREASQKEEEIMSDSSLNATSSSARETSSTAEPTKNRMEKSGSGLNITVMRGGSSEFLFENRGGTESSSGSMVSSSSASRIQATAQADTMAESTGTEGSTVAEQVRSNLMSPLSRVRRTAVRSRSGSSPARRASAAILRAQVQAETEQLAKAGNAKARRILHRSKSESVVSLNSWDLGVSAGLRSSFATNDQLLARATAAATTRRAKFASNANAPRLLSSRRSALHLPDNFSPSISKDSVAQKLMLSPMGLAAAIEARNGQQQLAQAPKSTSSTSPSTYSGSHPFTSSPSSGSLSSPPTTASPTTSRRAMAHNTSLLPGKTQISPSSSEINVNIANSSSKSSSSATRSSMTPSSSGSGLSSASGNGSSPPTSLSSNQPTPLSLPVASYISSSRSHGRSASSQTPLSTSPSSINNALLMQTMSATDDALPSPTSILSDDSSTGATSSPNGTPRSPASKRSLASFGRKTSYHSLGRTSSGFLPSVMDTLNSPHLSTSSSDLLGGGDKRKTRMNAFLRFVSSHLSNPQLTEGIALMHAVLTPSTFLFDHLQSLFRGEQHDADSLGDLNTLRKDVVNFIGTWVTNAPTDFVDDFVLEKKLRDWIAAVRGTHDPALNQSMLLLQTVVNQCFSAVGALKGRTLTDEEIVEMADAAKKGNDPGAVITLVRSVSTSTLLSVNDLHAFKTSRPKGISLEEANKCESRKSLNFVKSPSLGSVESEGTAQPLCTSTTGGLTPPSPSNSPPPPQPSSPGKERLSPKSPRKRKASANSEDNCIASSTSLQTPTPIAVPVITSYEPSFENMMDLALKSSRSAREEAIETVVLATSPSSTNVTASSQAHGQLSRSSSKTMGDPTSPTSSGSSAAPLMSPTSKKDKSSSKRQLTYTHSSHSLSTSQQRSTSAATLPIESTGLDFSSISNSSAPNSPHAATAGTPSPAGSAPSAGFHIPGLSSAATAGAMGGSSNSLGLSTSPSSPSTMPHYMQGSSSSSLAFGQVAPDTDELSKKPKFSKKLLYHLSEQIALGEAPLLLNISTWELAKQWTLLDHALICQVRSQDMILNVSRPSKSPVLTEIADRFNHATCWVATQILRIPNLKKRALAIAHLIALAECLLNLTNLHGFIAVVTGLSQHCVSRLSLTWKKVDPAAKKTFDALVNLASPIGNFKHLRTIHDNALPPFVPTPAMFLRDLLFVIEGNGGTFVQASVIKTDMILLSRKVLSRIQAAQMIHYKFWGISAIQKYLSAGALTTEELDSLAEQVESGRDL